MVLLPALKPACASAMIFSVRLWLQSVQHALQHDFAWVNDEADHSVVLAQLQVAFLGSVMTKDWVHGVGHLPVCQ